jgi:hypothetical protein
VSTDDVDQVGKVAKRQRLRLARAEVLMHLHMAAERWSSELVGRESGVLPFAEWPADDPWRVMARTYDLTAADLSRLCSEVADQMHARAGRAGYDETWDAK